MKAKMILLVLALVSTSLVFSQQVNHESKTDCEKKVLVKIKRNMNYLHVKDYLKEGARSSVVVTCFINEDHKVEIAKIDGSNEELKAAVIRTLEKHPVKCNQETDGNYFTFRMVFEHREA